MKVIITGASRGIGRGIASVLVRAGFQVGLLARSGERLEELRLRLGSQSFWAPADVRSASATERAVGELRAAMGGIDALINNAGVVIRKNAFDITLAEWRNLIDTNVHGVFHATRAVLGALRAQGRGHIINISSISGRLPLAGGSAYAASKYAVTGFSESLLQEVRDFGIKVTTVFPGSVETESRRDGSDASWKVRPEEVGEACLNILRTSPNNLIHRVEIRPLRVPKP